MGWPTYKPQNKTLFGLKNWFYIFFLVVKVLKYPLGIKNLNMLILSNFHSPNSVLYEPKLKKGESAHQSSWALTATIFTQINWAMSQIRPTVDPRFSDTKFNDNPWYSDSFAADHFLI